MIKVVDAARRVINFFEACNHRASTQLIPRIIQFTQSTAATLKPL